MKKKIDWRIVILIVIISFIIGHHMGVKKGAEEAAQLLFELGEFDKKETSE